VHQNLPLNARILHESWWVPKWGHKDKEGEVFVFGNGSFVCWGLDEEDARAFAKNVLGGVSGLEVGPLKEAETEELEFVMDPSECVFNFQQSIHLDSTEFSHRETRLQGDLIILGQTQPPSSEDISPVDLPPMVLPSETLLARYAFSQALSRSTALSALEVSLDDYLSSMALLPHSLEQTGKPGMSRTALIKKLGQLMKFRQGLNLNRENFSDVPDFYWAEPELERQWNKFLV
jgi:required for meiotic nuclear division protein 1